jgi:hypothetical protein
VIGGIQEALNLTQALLLLAPRADLQKLRQGGVVEVSKSSLRAPASLFDKSKLQVKF